MRNKWLERYKQMPVQVKAALWFLICAFLQKGISSLTTPIFTRLLSTSEYGQYSVFYSWLGILTIFVSLNLSSGVYMQGLVKFEKERKQFTSALQGLNLTLAVGWTVVYLLFRSYWNQLFSLTTVQMLAMLVMIWTTAVFGFWSTEQRVDLQYKKLVLLTLLVSVGKPVVGIFFVTHAQDKVTARILGLVLVELIAYTGLFIGQTLRGKKLFSGRIWKYVLKFNIPLIPHYLSMTVLSGADRIMIGKMVGDSEAGIYGLAYSVSLIMTMFNTALLQTIEPWLYKKIKSKKIEDIANVAYSTFSIIAAVNLLLIIFAPEVVAVFAPASYYDAIWVIPPVAMSVYFTFAYSFFAVFEFYYEKTVYVAVASAVGALLNIGLNYICIPVFGYYAAGYTTLVCYMIYAMFHLLFARAIQKKQFPGKRAYSLKMLFLITGLFLLAGFAMLMTYNTPWLRYAILAVCAIAAIIKRNQLANMIKRILVLRKANS